MWYKIKLDPRAFQLTDRAKFVPCPYLGRPYVWAFKHNVWSLPGGSKRFAALIRARGDTYFESVVRREVGYD